MSENRGLLKYLLSEVCSRRPWSTKTNACKGHRAAAAAAIAACVLWACCCPQLIAAGVLPNSEWAMLLQLWLLQLADTWPRNCCCVCTVCCGHGVLARRPAPSEHAGIKSSFLPHGPAGSLRLRLRCPARQSCRADVRGRPFCRERQQGPRGLLMLLGVPSVTQHPQSRPGGPPACVYLLPHPSGRRSTTSRGWLTSTSAGAWASSGAAIPARRGL